MPITSLEDLPYELQELVASHLNQGSQALCTRVCRTWYNLFNPVLWREVKCGADPFGHMKGDRSTVSSFLRSAAAGALKTNGHYIESLSLYLFQKDFVTLLEYCPTTFPQLTAIELGGCLDSRKETLSNFTNRCSAGLKTVAFLVFDKLDKSFDLAPGPIDALSKHLHTLEILRLTGEISLDGKLLNNLLCSAPKLKELYFPGNSSLEYGGWLAGQDVAHSEWACTDLEVFACEILGIDRPGISDEYDIRNAYVTETIGSTVQGSIDLQRRVYSQLARLINLRELRLGFMFDEFCKIPRDPFNDYHQTYTCLAMDLESGLDLLKDLKELRVVDLHNMLVGISKPAEQEWVAEHWPRAKIGCVDDLPYSEDEYEEDY
ncbi:hypothetical protein BGX24_003394 [Mortierella sp. AD032]|nr:hypothetical protein BGX24_003394 [Mortierella sp. AD032]